MTRPPDSPSANPFRHLGFRLDWYPAYARKDLRKPPVVCMGFRGPGHLFVHRRYAPTPLLRHCTFSGQDAYEEVYVYTIGFGLSAGRRQPFTSSRFFARIWDGFSAASVVKPGFGVTTRNGGRSRARARVRASRARGRVARARVTRVRACARGRARA